MEQGAETSHNIFPNAGHVSDCKNPVFSRRGAVFLFQASLIGTRLSYRARRISPL
jgi:hypothetical protein